MFIQGGAVTQSEESMRETLARALVNRPSLGKDEWTFCGRIPSIVTSDLQKALAKPVFEVGRLTEGDRLEPHAPDLDRQPECRSVLGRSVPANTAVLADTPSIDVRSRQEPKAHPRQFIWPCAAQDPRRSDG